MATVEETKRNVFLSVQEPSSKEFSGKSLVIYANKFISGGPVECVDEDLINILNSSLGNTGNNVLIQLKQKMAFYKNGPWYIDSIDGIIYIHNRKFQRDSSYVYTYAGEPGEVLSVTFRMVDVFKNNLAGVIGAIDEYTKNVANIVSYTLELKNRKYEDIINVKDDPYDVNVPIDNLSTKWTKASPEGTGSLNGSGTSLHPSEKALEISRINEETFKNDPGNPDYWESSRSQYNSMSSSDRASYNEKSSDEALANTSKEDLIKNLLEANPHLYQIYEQMVWLLNNVGENSEQYKSIKKEFDKVLAEEEARGIRIKTSKEVAAFRLYKANLTTKVVRVLKPELKLYDTENYSDEFLAAYISSGLRQKAIDEAIKIFQGSNYDSIDHSSIKVLPESIKDNQVGKAEYSAYHSTGDLYIQAVKYKTTFQISYYGYRSAQGYTSLTKAYRSLMGDVNTNPNLSFNEAAANLGKKLRERQLQAELKVVGNPALESSDQIILQNVGKKYSGVWYINSIVHSFEPGQGYISIIQLTKQLNKAETISQNINLNTQKYTGTTDTSNNITDSNGRPIPTVKSNNTHYNNNSDSFVASSAELSMLEYVLKNTKEEYKGNPSLGAKENRTTIESFATQIYLKNEINKDYKGAIQDLVSYNSKTKKFESSKNNTVEVQAKSKGIDINKYKVPSTVTFTNGYLWKLMDEYVGPNK